MDFNMLPGQTNNEVIVSEALVNSSVSTDSKLMKKVEGEEYTFEGVFGELGVRNRNGRIYTESEYIPQIEALRDKISKKKLLGELDHPRNFETSLKNASHVIEDISYNKESGQIHGRIKLLNTDSGKNAKALVDAGVPLHISSRAAGEVSEKGYVKLKKLFTYDLVADPGFANAELKRVYESVKSDYDPIEFINESLGLVDENVKIYLPDNTNQEKIQESEMDDTYLKESDFDQYTVHLKNEISSIHEKIDALTESISNAKTEGDDTVDENLTNEVEVLKKYVGKMRDQLNNLSSYVNENAITLDKLIEHNDLIVEHVFANRKYMKYIAENADANILMTEHVAQKGNVIAEYVDYMKGRFNTLSNFTEEEIVENLNSVSDYTQYLRENIELVGDFTQYITEKFNASESAQQKPADKTQQIDENLNENEDFSADSEDSVDTYKELINEKLNSFQSTQKQKVELDGEDYHFLRFVNESKKEEFQSLNEDEQAKLVKSFKTNKGRYFGEADVNQIWEHTLNPVVKLDYINNMPSNYKKIWENLSESTQGKIHAQAEGYKLETAYEIKSFWDSRDLRETSPQMEKIETVNESDIQVEDDKKEFVPGSINESYANSLIDEMKRRFGTKTY